MKPGSTSLSMPSRYQRCAFIASLHSIVQAGRFSFVTGILCHPTHIHLLKRRIGIFAVLIEKLIGAVELPAQSMLSDALAGPAVSAVVCELAAPKSHRSADAGRHLLLR